MQSPNPEVNTDAPQPEGIILLFLFVMRSRVGVTTLFYQIMSIDLLRDFQGEFFSIQNTQEGNAALLCQVSCA